MKSIDLVKLEKLCKMQSGGTPSRKNSNYWENGKILWAKISDLENSPDGFIYNTEEKISPEGLKSINNRIFSANTLFLAMYGSVGKVAISKVEMSTNQAILGINVIDENKLDLLYLKFWFNKTKEELLDKAVGVALKNISLGLVKDLEIPLPSLSVQKAIAEKLDQADALRKKDQELLAHYDELAQSVFIEMFGDPVKNEKGWEMVNFEEILKLKRGYDLPVQDRVSGGLIPVYGSNGILDYHDIAKTTKPCIVTGRSGTIGKVHISENQCWPLNTTLYSYETYDNNIIFLLYLLLNLKIERFAHGAGVPTLDRKIVHKEMIPNICKKLQNAFSEKIKNIEAQKALVKRQAEQSEDLFQALLQESFSF